MTTQRQNKGFKSGAVSLYVVIFTTLLISVITLSFLRIMLNEQIQTINSDLSQSAFDSALAGTQDAKTLITLHHECLSRGDNSAICQRIAAAIATQGCDTVRLANLPGVGLQPGEVPIVVGGGDDNPMNQAYTCVVVEMNTTDFVSESIAGESTIVPLRFTSDAVEEDEDEDEDAEDRGRTDRVEYITIQWFTQVNNQNEETFTSNLLGSSSNLTFPDINAWGRQPSVLRVQLIQTAEEFTLGQFDRNEGNRTNRATMFFFPTTASPSEATLTAEQVARTSSRTVQAPFAAHCVQSGFSIGGRYACEATFRLPDPIPGPDGSTQRHPGTSFLRITPLYRTTEFRVVGLNSNREISEGTRFLGVQPSIDSTGRANNVFRRVVSRVELTDVGFPFPEFAVELNDDGNPFCKAMLLTDVANESFDEGDCHQWVTD
ncbi:hypothetical protein FWD07_02915 [Candidatus Saccharibacteria bacterium]|nr:hypothetical protein [Candidatus Saccharibacteria bacterium]